MERLQALRELQRKNRGTEVFLVGGTVRDLIRKKKPNDLDLLVRGISPSEFERQLAGKGHLQKVGKSFGVYIFKPKDSEGHVEIAFPRTEVTTGEGHRDFNVISDPFLSIEGDSDRRDFTVNALYLNLENISEEGKFSKEDVIDFHSGLEHIRKRLIVAVGDPEDRIEEDPLRMLRAIVLVARTGYRLEGRTFGAIRKHAGAISSIAKERVRDEFIKIMESDKPSRAFKAMHRTQLLQEVLPELAACIGCGQNPKYHSYPVYEHLIYAVDAACSVTDRLDVRFGALCHDLGKAPTREVRPGGDGPNDVSFHNHEIHSTRLAFEFLKRLKFPREFVEQVIHLVRHHQYKYDREWTDKAVRRHIRKWGITRADLEDLDLHPQFLLRQADRMGNALKAHLPVTQKQRDFQRRIVKIYNESSAHSLRDLEVNGRDIMEEFSLKPSPLIRHVLDHLFEAVEEDPSLNTKDQLLSLAEGYIGEQADGGNQTNPASANSSN